jgi:hypothetical protein
MQKACANNKVENSIIFTQSANFSAAVCKKKKKKKAV